MRRTISSSGALAGPLASLLDRFLHLDRAAVLAGVRHGGESRVQKECRCFRDLITPALVRFRITHHAQHVVDGQLPSGGKLTLAHNGRLVARALLPPAAPLAWF
jgi:hypothetical protein